MEAYGLLRRRTEGHANAHFNTVDRALAGENPTRDAETAILLEQWLQRPRRDTGSTCKRDMLRAATTARVVRFP